MVAVFSCSGEVYRYFFPTGLKTPACLELSAKFQSVWLKSAQKNTVFVMASKAVTEFIFRTIRWHAENSRWAFTGKILENQAYLWLPKMPSKVNTFILALKSSIHFKFVKLQSMITFSEMVVFHFGVNVSQKLFCRQKVTIKLIYNFVQLVKLIHFVAETSEKTEKFKIL